ncbi:trypsin-like serine protease [Streptomyces sp. NPDC006140]|uniref:trypsin-like serine protease n=1 Tax=Streptomyces sp. NPDC006140 TaxID=3154579 RepID=UPI0033C3F4A5
MGLYNVFQGGCDGGDLVERGICRGDSGDPAVVNGSVKGIAIEDRGRGKSGEPAIFTDIAPLSDWLRWQ